MISDYKTGRLLPHLVAMGVLLVPVGILTIITGKWIGIAFVIIGLILFFFRHGVLIDTTEKIAKQYSGIWFVKSGSWQDISNADSLQIISLNESQSMSMLSINRKSYQEVDKLYLVLPQENIVLMSGIASKMSATAQDLASSLKLELLDKTKAPN